jgi:hypothetical protein
MNKERSLEELIMATLAGTFLAGCFASPFLLFYGGKTTGLVFPYNYVPAFLLWALFASCGVALSFRLHPARGKAAVFCACVGAYILYLAIAEGLSFLLGSFYVPRPSSVVLLLLEAVILAFCISVHLENKYMKNPLRAVPWIAVTASLPVVFFAFFFRYPILTSLEGVPPASPFIVVLRPAGFVGILIGVKLVFRLKRASAADFIERTD